MIFKNISFVVLAGLLTSCGSGSQTALDLDGIYNISAIATTEFAANGGTCGDATGLMTIENSELSGSVLSTNGSVFNISGNVAADGSVTGGFAQAGENAATFEGNFTANAATGTWFDIFECMGTWEADITQ